MITQDKFEQFNLKFKDFAKSLEIAAKSRIPSDTGLTRRSTKVYPKKNQGVFDKATFGFERRAVYLDKGAGRGYGGKRPPNPESKNKLGTGKRLAIHWFEGAADQTEGELVEVIRTLTEIKVFDSIDFTIR